MSPERPGRWVTPRQGPGKSWQASQDRGTRDQAFGVRLGAPSPILRCFLTGSWGSRRLTPGDCGRPGAVMPGGPALGASGWVPGVWLTVRAPTLSLLSSPSWRERGADAGRRPRHRRWPEGLGSQA